MLIPSSTVRAVLNETMRLFPPVPANFRTSRKAVAIPVNPEDGDSRPIYVPANVGVFYIPMLMHKRKDLWGPDADVFDPNRWLEDGTGRLDRMIKNPMMFVPFNAGPRIVSFERTL
jgi:cytochrome P450